MISVKRLLRAIRILIVSCCRDGLYHDRTNENQGAESSLAFYLAHAAMTLAQNLMEAQTPIVT
jgi:hypothetical protein